MSKLESLSYEEQNKIIDKALREHYRESMERKRVPSDYLLMFTEGGESNAVADAIAKAQLTKDANTLQSLHKEALEDMVWQFGYRGTRDGQPIIWTAGLSALESAFDELGWNDPHILPIAEGYCCEVEGCVQPDTSGLIWGELYLRLCSNHSKQCTDGSPRPQVRQWAIDREAKRDKVTGCLPIAQKRHIEQ